ncbi:lysocardiolipin acyltransferase 1 isoform X2 [Sylvia atricapilla]|uniref:lysocardiolipin acyltransferase 1 isoform X2 n=1 Tax=Sylvia atricapilla TaxID=48155 RepID=UPI003392408F
MEGDVLCTYTILGKFLWKYIHAGPFPAFDVHLSSLVPLDHRLHCGHLAHTPCGWAMQVAAFVFVQRKWEDDKNHFEKMLDYFCDIHEPLQLLIFPEGTDLTANTKARSNEFAEKNGLKKYEYVLHPRTTGFTFVVERLREGNNLDAIHDITVAYPQNIPQTEKHLLKGNFPKEIHFHVQRYPIETVPTSKEELQLWCRQRWEEKEERLRRFYEGGKCFSAAGQSIVPPCKSELRVLAVKCASLLYWTVFPLAMLALLYLYSFAQWYFATMILFFVVQQKIFGGLELIELACHQYFKKQQKFHDTKVKIN